MIGSLPDELLLHIIAYLDVKNALQLQLTCRQLCKLGKDNNSWKHRCFEDSRAEATRRRQQLLSQQDERLTQLRLAITNSTGSFEQHISQAVQSVGSVLPGERNRLKNRALLNWDPTYPGEDLNFYQEYVERHAPIWLEWASAPVRHDAASPLECVGAAIIDSGPSGSSQKVLAPTQDGSIRIYDLHSRGAPGSHFATSVHQSAPGLLFDGVPMAHHHLTRETESTDNVSVDSAQDKAYIATMHHVSELDLNTLQVTRRDVFPFPVSAISCAMQPVPITIGTSDTLHLLDPRAPKTASSGAASPSARCELIAGSVRSSPSGRHRCSTQHATLSQPGPQSIVHEPFSTNSIWIAGRFTSLLHYDRRYWPQISGTLFSGSRLSSLSLLPRPFVPRIGPLSVDILGSTSNTIKQLQQTKAGPGVTLVAAGEYKGKGSIELYGISPQYEPSQDRCYRNRQTASKSRLLSVTPHGARLVFSDGDGNIKWTERDGKGSVRTFNLNQEEAAPLPDASGSLFAPQDNGESDIVRKIIPRITGQDTASSQPATSGFASGLSQDDLLLWTGDGRLALLGFGTKDSIAAEDLHVAAEDADEAATLRHEREYEQRMREALERQADDARFVRGLGLGY